MFGLLLASVAYSQPGAEIKKNQLFNGKDLSGWDTYIGRLYDSVSNRFTSDIPGLGKNPDNVFSVVMADNKPAIRISGQHFGGISTIHEFENFHLMLEFKWGARTWPPKRNQKKDSGVLYFAVGPHGADGGFWMRSQECQVQEGDCGDYWGCAGGIFDVPAVPADSPEKLFLYNSKAPLLQFSELSPQGRRCIKNPDAENKTGAWNVLEIYCSGPNCVHRINGITVMQLFNSRQLTDGKEIPLTKGKIQIQSEGAEIFYRNITIESITEIPARVREQRK